VPVNEETSTPYVDWDYHVITEDGALDSDFRERTIKAERGYLLDSSSYNW
jgi:hypothetical protein